MLLLASHGTPALCVLDCDDLGSDLLDLEIC